MSYANIEVLKDAFIKGSFNFPQTIYVNDIKFNLRSSSSFSMEKMVINKIPGVVVYTSSAPIDKLSDANLQSWIIFIWSTIENKLVPQEVKTVSKSRGNNMVSEEDNNVVGEVVEIKFVNIPNAPPIKGKVDTGADVSSLHTSGWKINGNSISFTCPFLSNNILTMPLHDKQAIKSADGGIEYRPVIKLDVELNGNTFKNVLFNLNNRENMKYPLLVGKNLLQQGKFLINPSIGEEIDFDYIITQIQQDLQHLSEKQHRWPKGYLAEERIYTAEVLNSFYNDPTEENSKAVLVKREEFRSLWNKKHNTNI